MKPILVQTTTNSIKEAKKISKILLEKKSRSIVFKCQK